MITIPDLLRLAADEYLKQDASEAAPLSNLSYLTATHACNAIYIATQNTAPDARRASLMENRARTAVEKLGIDLSDCTLFDDVEHPQSTRFMMLHLAALVMEDGESA